MRPYIPLLTEILMESAMEKDGVLIPHEEVIKKLNEDTVSGSAGIGIGGGTMSSGKFSQCVVIGLQVLRDNYDLGVQWIHDLMFKTKFTTERVKVIATKVENGIAQLKRSGSTVMMAFLKSLTFGKRNNRHWDNMMSQQKFLKELLKKLNCDDEGGKQEVVAALEAVRNIIVSKYAFFVATNFEKVPHALDLLEKNNPVKKCAYIIPYLL